MPLAATREAIPMNRAIVSEQNAPQVVNCVAYDRAGKNKKLTRNWTRNWTPKICITALSGARAR